MPSPDWNVLSGPAATVAPHLLGALMVRELNGQRLVGKIVEVEAYDQRDAASHSFYGREGRAVVTFGPAGHLYVHASRHHFLCDITTGLEDEGSSVLIRAVEPLEGLEQMRLLRGDLPDDKLTNGPAKFCQAFAIDKQLNAHDLRESPLRLVLQPPLASECIIQTTRVGITKDAHRLWRFLIKNSPYVSKAA